MNYSFKEFMARRAMALIFLAVLAAAIFQFIAVSALAETYRIGFADIAIAVFSHPRMRYFEPVSERFLKTEMLAAAIERKERSAFRKEMLTSMTRKQQTLLDTENTMEEIRGLEKERDEIVGRLNEIKSRISRRIESETRGLVQRDPERARVEEKVLREQGGGSLGDMEKRLAEILRTRTSLTEEIENLAIAKASSDVYSNAAESFSAVRTVVSDIRRALERVKNRLKLSTIVNGSYLARNSYLLSGRDSTGGNADEAKDLSESVRVDGTYREILRNDDLFRGVVGGNLVPFSRKNLVYSEVTFEVVAELMDVCNVAPDYSAAMKKAAASISAKSPGEIFDLDKRRGF